MTPLTRTLCTLFSGFTHKSHQPPIIRYSALAIDTCMGPSGTLGEWYSALSRRSEKNSHGHKEYRRTWFWPTLMWKHQWSDMKWPPPRCHPIFKSHICHCMPGVLHHHLASFPNCVIPRLSHPRTRLHFLYFPSYFIRCYQLKFSISNLWSANNIINQRPVPDSKKFKNHWPRQSIHARTILVRDVQWRGWSGLAVGPWDIIHDLHLRVPRAPHWVNPALIRSVNICETE